MGKKSKRNKRNNSSGKQRVSVPQAPQAPDLSSTMLAKESYCMACGTPSAPMLCQCGQVSFCDAGCAKTVWAEHRLVCPAKAGKERKKGSTFLPGDIVKIHGLAGETGMQWNDCLAEIQSYNKNTEQYAVIFSTKTPFEIKSVLVHRENLELQLTVEHAAHAAHGWDKENPKARKPMLTRDQLQEIQRVALEPRRFIHELENHNPIYILATYFFAEIMSHQENPALYKEYLECGLANAVFKNFSFPLMIDTHASEIFCKPGERKHDCMPGTIMLKFCLRETTEYFTRSEVSKFVKEIIQVMGPYIMIMCSKKHRMFGSLNNWCSFQCTFIQLLGVCSLASREAFADAIYSLPPECWASLMEHLVLLSSVDHKKFLQSASSYAVGHTTSTSNVFGSLFVTMSALLDYECVKPSLIKQFGMIPIPFGAQNYIGCSFASVAPKIFARIILDGFDRSQFDSESVYTAEMEFGKLTSVICTCFHETHSLDSETSESNGYSSENLKRLDSWDGYVDRSMRILQSDSV